jgi:hypothetical protein
MWHSASAAEMAFALALGFIDQGIAVYMLAKGVVTGDSV